MEIEIRRHSPRQPWTYSLLDRRQREIAARVQGGGEGAFLLSEVAPVITLGRRASPADLLIPIEELKSRGVEIRSIDRGGLGTYHGPGQWILFTVNSLERLTGDRRGIRRAIEGLLKVALRVGGMYRPGTQIRWGRETGVWSDRGKFAAVGVKVEQGVLLHGLAINGFQTPQSFVGLKPCGLDAPVDYLLGNPGHFEKLGEEIIQSSLEEFRC